MTKLLTSIAAIGVGLALIAGPLATAVHGYQAAIATLGR